MFNKIYRQFFDVKREEWPRAIGLALFFFLVIATFWVLKPIKRGLIISYFSEDALSLFGYMLDGSQAEQVAKVLNMFVAYAVVIGFTFLVRRVGRSRLIVTLSGIFAALFAAFSFFVSDPSAGSVWSFYVLGDIFNTVMVATFWAFANDVNTGSEAERLYGVVGLGGVLGGFVGATTVSTFVEPLGRGTLLWICAALMVLIAIVAVWIDRYERDEDASVACCPEESEAAGRRAGVIWEGARVVMQSRYLLAIAALVGVYEIVSNVADFQLASFVEMQIAGSTEKDAFFGFIGQITGIVSILVQLFVTTFVLRRFGAGVALFFLPIAFLLGSTGFLVIPTLFIVAFLRVSDNGLNYSINQSAREALYTPTSQDAKYKAKAFIDMFIQRAAKVLAVGVNLGLTVLAATQVRWLSLISVPLIIVWLLLARFLKNEFTRKKLEKSEIPDETSPESP